MKEETPYLNFVYEKLTTGHFICSNSLDEREKVVYRNVEENLEQYRTYFSQIGLTLEMGNEYFYFSRKETPSNIRKRLLKFSEWIVVEDFLMTVDVNFGVGYRFRLSHFENRVTEDSECKRKLYACCELKKKQKDANSERERLEKVCEWLRSEGFIEEVSAEDGEFQVTNAFDYLLQLNDMINIKYEDEYESA